MGGCAVEFDCARRAHLDPKTNPDNDYGAVYHGLCKAFSRELVIDIMSGSSAGGINGALLAAAISGGRRIDSDYLRGRWLGLGDFSGLLQPLSNSNPRALMDGDKFHGALLDTFRAVLGKSDDTAANGRSALPDDARPATLRPVLNITTTDLTGTELVFRDEWDETLTARDYRACFRFREPDDFTAENLAAAARSSASFPIAFEPWKVKGTHLRRLAGFSGPRWVMDGGLLDNAPIRMTLNAIPASSGERQERRFVCYINGEPPEALGDDDVAPEEPELAQVLAAVINLPRKAPFADELAAIDLASRRATLNEKAEIPLLALDRDCLVRTAAALLPLYRRRRRLRSLLEILDQPGDAAAVFDRLGDSHELPWIPKSLDVPRALTWGWGNVAAQRVHYLMVDLIDSALPSGKEEGREALLRARTEIFVQITTLRRGRIAFQSDACVKGRLEAMLDQQSDLEEEVASLGGFTGARDVRLYKSVRATAEWVFGVSVQIGALGGVPVGEALFGSTWIDGQELSDAMFDCFLQRVLAIEVIRRAFTAEEEVVQAQPLAFAQLTPFAPTPILSKRPVTAPPQMSPRRKLTGIALGHFGAFYRRSWRANDFMWGRLDAAARIVPLLVDAQRAQEGAAHEISGVLLERAADHEWLIEEVLRDAGHASDEELDAEDLPARLEGALALDLHEGDGSLTRLVCVVVAQLEILRHELPCLAETADEDADLGSSPGPLGLPNAHELGTPEGVKEAIASLREGDALPTRLGRGTPAEETSDLAVRTISRTGLVTLSVLRQGVPFALPLQLMRAVLLPVSGVVARHWYSRLVGLTAFWAAALFLAGRIVTTKNLPADLARLSLGELLVSMIALLVVLGTALLPLYRFARGDKGGKVAQGLWFALLVGSGAGATIALALVPGPLNVDQLIVQPGAKAVPRGLLAPTVFIVLGIVIVPIFRPIRSRLVRAGESARGLRISLVFPSVAALFLGGWAVKPLVDAISQGETWQQSTAIVALAAPPITAALYLFVREPFNRYAREPLYRLMRGLLDRLRG